MKVNAYGSLIAAQERGNYIVRGRDTLVATDQNVRLVSTKEDLRVVLRASLFNILFSRIRLILMSIKFVPVIINEVERNLQG